MSDVRASVRASTLRAIGRAAEDGLVRANLNRMNAIQQAQLSLIALTQFNEFDGQVIARDLIVEAKLWLAAALLPADASLVMRDLPNGDWHASHLWILPASHEEDEQRLLLELAREWRADTAHWVGSTRRRLPIDLDRLDPVGMRGQLVLWWD